MQLFIKISSEALQARKNPIKGARFWVRSVEVGFFRVLNKTRLEGDPILFTFGCMKLFDTMQHGGPTGA